MSAVVVISDGSGLRIEVILFAVPGFKHKNITELVSMCFCIMECLIGLKYNEGSWSILDEVPSTATFM